MFKRIFNFKKSEKGPDGGNLYLIAGLGNPGRQYEATRHNIGFEVIDYVSQKHHIRLNKLKHRALFGEGRLGGVRVILAKPQTFMNLSGECIRDIVNYYKIPLENIVIVYDDISLPTGAIRIRARGSAGGHNGMKSIIYHLQSDEFTRLRIGIGAPQHKGDLTGYVLVRFSDNEAKEIADAIKTAAEALLCIIQEGAPSAAGKYNRGRGPSAAAPLS